MRLEKQRFGDVNFSGGEILLMGQFFAVGSLGSTLLEAFLRLYSFMLLTNTYFRIYRASRKSLSLLDKINMTNI